MFQLTFENRSILYFCMQVLIDEEREANAIDSSFKADINKIFQDALILTGISMEEVQNTPPQGIMRWFKYLTVFFMPTLPIWSNLLLGIDTSLSTITYVTQSFF